KSADGQTKEVKLTVKANGQSITGSDFSMYVGDPTPTVSDFKGSATDKTGAAAEVTVDLNGADLKTAGVYTAVLKSADGQTKEVKLTVKANGQSITGSDFSMYVGDPTPTVSDFKGSATDKTGAASEVTVDLNGADLKTAGVYTVVLKSADGQTKEVKLTVKALVHTNSSSLNHKDPINNSLSSNISSSKQPLPQTGDASSVSVLATFVGVLIMSLVTLLGVSQWKKRD
ncbi:ribosome-binding factor A, partial [Lactococcus lactis]